MLMHDVKKLLDPVSLSIIFPPQKNLKSFKDINVEVFRINIVNLDFLHTLLYYKAPKKKKTVFLPKEITMQLMKVENFVRLGSLFHLSNIDQ